MARLSVNLASEPFVNRVVPLATMGSLASLAAALTVLNLTLFAIFGGEYRRLLTATSKQQARLTSLASEIDKRRAEMASPGVATFMGEAVFMDRLIKTKSFSWTLMLTRLEEAKAYGIMLQAVTPNLEKDGRIVLVVRGVANPREEMWKFENNLFASRYFRNATLHAEQKDAANPWTAFDMSVDYSPEGYPPQPGPPPPPAPQAANAPTNQPGVATAPASVQRGAKVPPPSPGAKAQPPAAGAGTPPPAPVPPRAPTKPGQGPATSGLPSNAPSQGTKIPPLPVPPPAANAPVRGGMKAPAPGNPSGGMKVPPRPVQPPASNTPVRGMKAPPPGSPSGGMKVPPSPVPTPAANTPSSNTPPPAPELEPEGGSQGGGP